MPDNLQSRFEANAHNSNIAPRDYSGPEACKKCHAKNYKDWLGHAHRLMNALATSETVLGDFSGKTSIRYLGGVGRFYHSGDSYRMKLIRDGTTVTYDIHQTIGSRFFQYYVGTVSDGPFSADHVYRNVDHVLPFGYWLDHKEWVPIVHVSDELPDGRRHDPFQLPQMPTIGVDLIPYNQMCNVCHTTFPLGDNLARKPNIAGKHAPGEIHLDLAAYLADAHPELLPSGIGFGPGVDGHLIDTGHIVAQLGSLDHATSMGISCEACHMGCVEHARNPRERPPFYPQSRHVLFGSTNVLNESTATTDDSQTQNGRTIENINWICSRCHSGSRPQFAAGISTWNSTEFSDAARGSCYSQLRCIDCHSPHQGIGHQWSKTPAEDDASCIRCHVQYESNDAIVAHTHHPAESSGSRCMNCHMPRINEGLQAVVRTHTIFSPTDRSMIEANHPNACNICHTSESINWTLTYLQNWYGRNYSEEMIQATYPQTDSSVAAGWMSSDNESVRLVATDAAARAKDDTLLPNLVEMLDDPYLLNRQFTRVAIENMCSVRLLDYGYRFHMTPDERTEPINRIRAALNSGELRIPSSGQSNKSPVADEHRGQERNE